MSKRISRYISMGSIELFREVKTIKVINDQGR